MRHNRIFEGVMAWLRPAVVGLIGAAAAILVLRTGWTDGHPFLEVVEENFPDWKSWLLFGGALVASFCWKAGPILLIVAGGVIGFLIY
jgi:chromate transport protein ChrA